MGSQGFLFVTDDFERSEALDPSRSFIVQAPAGSGKTELLIQRYLRLLAVVEKPERILAMTFTRKAAAEMRERVLGALTRSADAKIEPHEQLTNKLAIAARKRNEAQGWGLLENPARIKVQTIDSLCGSLVAQMPWLSRQGALPQIVEDASSIYSGAAQRTVLLVERETPHRPWLEHLLLHLDNKTSRVTQLIAQMLAKRDQWIEFAYQIDEGSREAMERILEQVVREAYEGVEQWISPQDLRLIRELYGDWDEAVGKLLTKSGTWLKDFEKKQPCLAARLQENAELLGNLKFLRKLPPRQFEDGQWMTLRSLLEVLKLAVGQLHITFREREACDFAEVALAARWALGHAENPTDLALKLDSQIDHLLIDEFQDTAVGQFELIKKLIEGWEQSDGRTLFVVGDPMQSIYRFRQAEVGMFLRTAEQGIGSLQPQALVLRANYRSVKGIIEWVNRVFLAAFPSRSDWHTGAVSYSESDATREDRERSVVLHPFPYKDSALEAQRVIELIHEAHSENPGGSVAILVRARSHLPAIVEAIKEARLSFRAVKIDDLGQRQVARDLLSLTRAMLHLGDRVAWLALLRAPWCGLSLADLFALAGSDSKALIWDLLQGDLIGLTEDGRLRAVRLRSIVAEAFAQRGRAALRVWIESTWKRLGGAACLQSSGEVKDATDFFDLIEREEVGADLPDFDGFSTLVDKLKAQADPHADESLQLMTIHEAKGLQFDTVILPGLGKGSPRENTELFLYHEGLVAPIRESGGEKDPIYGYLQEIEKRKSANELVRLLYVATTRAKKRLHLLGFAGTNGKPPHGSFLSVLWLGLNEEERQLFINAAEGSPKELIDEVTVPIRRLPLNWEAPVGAAPLHWERRNDRVEPDRQPTFEWAGDNLRHAGTVVHAILQRIAKDSGYRALPLAIRTSLAQLGVPADDLDPTASRVESAIAKTVASRRGQWILGPQKEAHCELTVNAQLEGKILSGRIDRTFIDSDGTRWVIDFKTSWHEGGRLAAFLDEQQRRYTGQMERYGQLFKGLGAPVRLGLYFPLLDEWREWGI